MLPTDYQPATKLLADRVILVTGAGQGLGQMAARSFARHGATVVLSGRSQKKLEQTYDQIIQDRSPEPAMLPLDLATADDAMFQGFAQSVHQTFGRLDGILHSAVHFVPLAPLPVQTLDQWLTLLRVNLAAPFALTRACLPMLKRSKDASVVFTSETHARDPKAYWGGFAVAKAGLHTLATIWNDELADTTVRVNCYIPGPVASPQRRQSHPGEALSSLPAAENLATDYLFLIGPDGRNLRGAVVSRA